LLPVTPAIIVILNLVVLVNLLVEATFLAQAVSLRIFSSFMFYLAFLVGHPELSDQHLISSWIPFHIQLNRYRHPCLALIS